MALQYLFLFRILKKFTSLSKVFQQGFSLSQKLPVFLHNVTSSEKPFLPTLSKIGPYLQPITLSFTFFITHHYLKLYYKLPTTECLIRPTRGTPSTKAGAFVCLVLCWTPSFMQEPVHFLPQLQLSPSCSYTCSFICFLPQFKYHLLRERLPWPIPMSKVGLFELLFVSIRTFSCNQLKVTSVS